MLAVYAQRRCTIKSNLKEYWPFLTSVLFVVLSTLGFIYSWVYYNQFGINYLDYAELKDLFSVLFVHPHFLLSIFVFTFGLLLSILVSIYSDTDDNGDHPELARRIELPFRFATIFLFLIVVTSPIWILRSKINDIKGSLQPIYEISTSINDLPLACVINIGTTSSTLFFWDVLKKEALIIPRNKMERVSVIFTDPPENGRRPPAKPGSISDFEKEIIKWENDINARCKVRS